jgi:UDP-glucose 4-epimerase
MKVLITGGAGYIGSNLQTILSKKYNKWEIYSCDIKSIQVENLPENTKFFNLDISDRDSVLKIISDIKPNSIVHLASILNPPPGMSESTLRNIEVEGTRNILDGAVISGCEQIIVTSSGAAYGYYEDNPEWIKETDPIRGHPAFAYSKHKKEIEDLLTTYRQSHAQLKQLILRPGTVLGPTVNNLITDLFKKRGIVGVKGYNSRFVFIWDEDVINIIIQGIEKKTNGIFNLAGDGCITMEEIANILNKPYIPIPYTLFKLILKILYLLRLSQYSPDQIDFIRFRPVLSNQKLKTEFGFIPSYTSKETFLQYLKIKGINYAE